MDYFHPVRNAAFEVAKVPYILVPYCGTIYEDFPRIFGYLVTETFLDDFSRRHVTLGSMERFSQSWEYLGFTQACLYLGLLIEVLNEALGYNENGQTRLVTEDFTSMENGVSFVTTSRLSSYIPLWISRAKRLKETNQSEFQSNATKIFRVIDKSWEHTARLLASTITRIFDSVLCAELQSSITILGSLLDSVASETYGRAPWTWPPSFLALERLSKSCPYELHRVNIQYTADVVYYISSLRSLEDSRDHRRCREEKCVASQSSDEDYRIMHSEHCGGCPMVGPDLEQVKSILRLGDIPHIAISNSMNSIAGLQLEVVKSSNVKYIAISHVWSDGLGNPRENQMRRCQVERLRRLVKEFFGADHKIFFWIDTLCVPLSKDMRKVAIQRMSSTYKNATHVLVLDSQLQRISACGQLDSVLLTEIMLRIANSGWMKRLWTFQEGRFAKQLIFQFADKTLDLLELIIQQGIRFFQCFDPVANQGCFQLMSIVSLTSSISHGQGFQQLSDTVGWPDIYLRHVFNALSWRSTSRAEDEAVCLASLLNLDPGIFLDIPLEEHIPKLLLQIRKVPINLLFARGPRHDAPGFGWCPSSFLNSEVSYTSQGKSELAECTASGLKVRLPGWIMKPSTIEPCKNRTLFDWWIRSNLSKIEFFHIFHEFEITQSQRKRPLAIVVASEEHVKMSHNGTRPLTGICVISEKKEGVLWASYLGRVSISRTHFSDPLSDEIPSKFA